MSDELFAEKVLRNTTRSLAEFLPGILPLSGDTFQRPALAHCILEVGVGGVVILALAAV